MIRPSIATFLTFCFLCGSVLLGGCAIRAKTTIPRMNFPDPPQSTLVLEAKAETAQIRSALASERIKSAKQAASLRLAQEQASSLREREAEHTATISRLKAEIDAIKAERDRLKTDNADLRAKTASLPELLKMVTQIRTLETSLTGMTSSLESLSGEISHMKQDIKKKEAPPPKVAKKNRAPSRPSAQAPDPSNTEVITVERGDSLWRLGRQYDISIKELKKLNNLESDLIVVGQPIRVPVLSTQPNEEMAGMSSPQKTPNP